jgi:hypothetical protein
LATPTRLGRTGFGLPRRASGADRSAAILTAAAVASLRTIALLHSLKLNGESHGGLRNILRPEVSLLQYVVMTTPNDWSTRNRSQAIFFVKNM